MDLFTTIILLSLFIIVLIMKWQYFKHTDKNSPPSPPKLPILGNLHQVGLFPHRSLKSLAEKHGPLMLLHFGNVPVLVVSSADMAEEVMKTHDLVFSNRPPRKTSEILLYDSKDIATSPYGEYWRQIRSLAVLHLLSNKRVQSYGLIREEEAARMVETIKEFASSSFSMPLNLSEIFFGVTNDILCRSALGRRYRGGGEGCKFQELVLEFGDLLGTTSIGDYIPWLSWLNKVDGSYKRASRVAKRLDEFLDQVIAEHVSSGKRKEQEGLTDNVDDFVDVLLSVKNSNAVGFEFDTTTMKAILVDMFAAGTDTTYTVLEWAMAELLKRPAVMHKLQDEVRTVVGNRSNITEQDLVHMNYLKAVIKETLRLHPSLPVLVPRESTKGIKLNGYDIEAGTQVLVNAWAVATDPKCWDQPLEFKPERFLNSSVDFKGCDFQFIPFGAGRRGCPGLQFATAVDEIVLATLVHHFDWDLSAASKEVDMSETHGLALHLKSPLLAIATPYYE
ncbi:hypothetical protein AHAS_Ahas03G0277500 [Arachis hypogaea]